MTTTVASSSHETINPANIVQPRAFVIAETVAGLLTVASACIPSFPVRAGVPSCPVAPSSTAFDGRGDAIGPVPTVEEKSPTLPLASTPIDAGRAFRFRGRGGRLFFIAHVPTVRQSPMIVGIEWNVVSARNALAPRRGSAERGSGSLIIFKAVTGDHRDVIRSAILAAKPATPQFDPIQNSVLGSASSRLPSRPGSSSFFLGALDAEACIPLIASC